MRNLDPEWSEGEIESGQVVKIQISGRTFGGCLSIKGRTKWKDKVSTSISILVSKRVFNRRHARTCAASDMSRVSVCARILRVDATRAARIFSPPCISFLLKTLRDANLFVPKGFKSSNRGKVCRYK